MIKLVFSVIMVKKHFGGIKEMRLLWYFQFSFGSDCSFFLLGIPFSRFLPSGAKIIMKTFVRFLHLKHPHYFYDYFFFKFILIAFFNTFFLFYVIFIVFTRKNIMGIMDKCSLFLLLIIIRRTSFK